MRLLTAGSSVRARQGELEMKSTCITRVLFFILILQVSILDLEDIIKCAYLASGLGDVWDHVEEVAEISRDIALRFGLDPVGLRTSALLHDISAVMSDDEMYELAKSQGLDLDPSEERYHFLLHQRISAIIARERYGVSDGDILSAIECHTTLKMLQQHLIRLFSYQISSHVCARGSLGILSR
ncbi:MAG: HD domain-containing protein [Ruminococcaceae bacterium]|nr:HD domain-containing protein [Oscillospiraceae bacterium]